MASMQADVVAVEKAWAAKEPKDLPTSLKSDREGEVWMDGWPIAKIIGDRVQTLAVRSCCGRKLFRECAKYRRAFHCTRQGASTKGFPYPASRRCRPFAKVRSNNSVN